MPELTIDFEMWCSCGKGICGNVAVKGQNVTVDPCESCLDSAKSDGYRNGYDEGYAEGQQDAADD